MMLHSKVVVDGNTTVGRGFYNKKATSIKKLHDCSYCFYIYPNGSFEIAKNRLNGVTGEVDFEQVMPILTRIMADLKLKDTNLEMFKEGLSELLQEAITNTLKGDYYERPIRTKSSGNGT